VPSHLIPRDRLQQLLAGAPKKRIAVIGDAMLDVYLRGDVDRISPEAPVPVVRVRERRYALGGAANVAQNVSALGATAELVATTKTRVLARAQQLVRVDEEVDDDCTAAEVAKIIDAVTIAVNESDALILEDYNKGVLVESVIRHAIALAKARRIPIVVDPKYRNFFAYAGATVFKPNRRELEAALGAAVSLDHPETLPALVERLDVSSVLLTLSEHGMALIERGASEADGIHRIPTTAREVYDVVGAGDTVTAYLAAMLASGATALEAAVIANFAAGIEVGKLGAATVTPDEVLAAHASFV
jgi:rfaE bifunctional protein kinase chain/domain